MNKKLDGNVTCPCGSGKKYYECCYDKDYIYEVKANGDIVKKIPMCENIIEIVKDLKEMFFKNYGREILKDEFIFTGAPNYCDDTLLNIVYELRKCGIDEKKIYAYYKNGGLIITDENLDMVSEKDILEYERLCKEYTDAIEEESEESVNSIQFTLFANDKIEESIGYALKSIFFCLNDFIRRHSKDIIIQEYEINNELDYCMFSALKTIRTLQSIKTLLDAHQTESIYALSRGIFENYMYMCSINNVEDFFNSTIYPKVDSYNYSFEKYSDGRVNYRKVISKETGCKINVEPSNNELKKNFFSKRDDDLYEFFYRKACSYIHVDIMSAKSYFSTTDPYDEVDPTKVSCLISVSLVLILMEQISRNKMVQDRFRKDSRYLIKNIRDSLIICFDIMKLDDRHYNVIYEIIIQRLKELCTD